MTKKNAAQKAALDAIVPLAAHIRVNFRIPTEAKLALGMKRA